jgi:16S rRNA (cytosine1402-N4)-methyltransferase
VGHVSVLVREVLQWLEPRPGGKYLDGTVGLGGHGEAILREVGGNAHLLGIDRDSRALEIAAARLAPFGNAVDLRRGDYSSFPMLLRERGWDTLDGMLLDVGVSSLQLDSPERGFSFLADGPLDMRMSPGGPMPPASRLVNKAGVEELKRIIGTYGEEPMGGRIARAIVEARAKAPIEGTRQLAEIVERAYPAAWRAKARNHPATRTFQALRIAVNDELGELERFLRAVPEHLAPGGRVVVISFHSLEDRLVKRAFREEARECRCPREQMRCSCSGPRLRILTKKPVTPQPEEAAANPRARSARLRAAERTEAA